MVDFAFHQSGTFRTKVITSESIALIGSIPDPERISRHSQFGQNLFFTYQFQPMEFDHVPAKGTDLVLFLEIDKLIDVKKKACNLDLV